MASQSSPINTRTTKAIDLSEVQAADIILTSASTSGSNFIRGSTCGNFSHAILALDNGLCIEAMPKPGVSMPLLSDTLITATYAVRYRHKDIDSALANWVCFYADQQKGKPYDHFGAARSGASTGCSITKQIGLGFVVEMVHEVSQSKKHNDKFFCSELVAFAFEKAGIPLLSKPARAATPNAIATSDKLDFQEVLIA